MPTCSILSILVNPQSGYLLVYHIGLSLVHCSYLSEGSLQLYTSGARSHTSFLRFHKSSAREYSPSLFPFLAEPSPYWSQGPVTPTPRVLTSVAVTHLASITTPLLYDVVAVPPVNQDQARNLHYPPAVTLSTSDTVTFEIFGNLYFYTQECQECWME